MYSYVNLHPMYYMYKLYTNDRLFINLYCKLSSEIWDHDGYPSTTLAVGLDLALRNYPQAKFHNSSSDCSFNILLPQHNNNSFITPFVKPIQMKNLS